MARKTLQDKKDSELATMLLEKREALQAFRFGGARSSSRNVREGRAFRREIARILTEQNKRSRTAA